MIAAAVLRLWGIGWGFPLQRGYVDEFVTVFYSMKLFETGPHPHFFDYPSLYLYLLWFVLFLLRLLTGRVLFSPENFLGNASVAPIWAGRILTFALAMATVLLVVWAGRAWRDERTGLWAGLFLALQSVHVRMSHYAMPDILAVALTAAAILLWIRFLSDESEKKLAGIGLLLGLAVAAKYTPGFLVPGFMVWLLLRKNWRAAAVLAGAASLGFFLGSPFSFFAWRDFIPRLGLLSSHIIVGQTPSTMNPFSRWGHSLIFLPEAFHPALFVSGLAGFFWSKDSAARSLAWAAFFYFLFTGLWMVVADRYYLPLVPMACLGAGCFLSRLSERRPLHASILGAAVAMLLLWPSVKFDAQISRRDTRLEMRDWVRAHVQDGARILRFPHTTEFTSQDPFAVKVDWEGRVMDQPPTALLAEFDYVMTAHFSPQPDDIEKQWSAEAQDIHSVSDQSMPAFPHQPRLHLWAKKNQ